MPRLLAFTANLLGISGHLLVIVALLTAGQVHAQGHTREEQLVGAWRAAGILIEFRADGRFRADISGQQKPVMGQWQVVDSKHLLTWSDSSRPKRINEFSIRGDYMMVIQSPGRVVVHQRVETLPRNSKTESTDDDG